MDYKSVRFGESAPSYAALNFPQIRLFAAYPLGKCDFTNAWIWASETADLVPSAQRSK